MYKKLAYSKVLLRITLILLLNGLNFRGIDSQVFLPIITTFFFLVSCVLEVILVKYAISVLKKEVNK